MKCKSKNEVINEQQGKKPQNLQGIKGPPPLEIAQDERRGQVLPEKNGWVVRPVSQNRNPISDQNLRFSLP